MNAGLFIEGTNLIEIQRIIIICRGENMKNKSADWNKSSQVPSETEIRQVVTRILASKYFANAPSKQRLLRLICEAYLD